MLFSSYTFLFLFLPAVLALYFLLPLALPRRCSLAVRNAVLLITSLLFYAWGEPAMVLLMIGTVLCNWLFALCLSRTVHKKALLTLAVSLDLALLFFFKYAPALAGLFGITFPAVHLPLGISFYTFQALSYVVDVYRGEVEAARSPARIGTYIALFPQLIAGPIVRYTDVADDLAGRSHSVPQTAAGVRRLVAGLCKKVLLANAAGELFAAFTATTPAFLGAWLGLFGFAFQIYFDFSGYSDMAIGLGQIFGFQFPENFNYPYIATSFTDFWRRWHITLSSFFRSYVYIPLGGNRKGIRRTLLNLFIVWSLTGLWHGAALNFLLWGIYWFALLAAEKFLLRDKQEALPMPLRRLLVCGGILFGWLIFAFDGSTASLDFSAFCGFLGALFGANGLYVGNEIYELLRHLPFLALCFFGATPMPRALYRRFSERGLFGRMLPLLLPIAGAFLSIAYLADAGFNPFLYFRF